MPGSGMKTPSIEKNVINNVDISVIVPVYNVSAYIKKCVNSILNQSKKEFELILVDDGSDDGSEKICDEYEKKDNRVRVLHLKNSGVSRARNCGIKKSCGRYIVFFDADDYVDANALECMYDLASQENLDLVITGYYFEIGDSNGNVIQQLEQKIPDMKLLSVLEIRDNLVYLWNESMMYNIWNKLFDASIIRSYAVAFPKDKFFNEDREFVRMYIGHCKRIQIIEKCMYHYIKEHGNTATERYQPELFDIRIEEYRQLEEFFKNWNISSEDYSEYLSRQHMERLVGCVENMFHSPDVSVKKICNRIDQILKHAYTKSSIQKMKPTSLKMKIMLLSYKWNSIPLVFMMTWLIFELHTWNPKLFNRLKHKR